MSLSTEILAELQEKYEALMKDIDYNSALGILYYMKMILEALLPEYPRDSKNGIKLLGMLGWVYLKLGDTTLTNDESIGERYLNKCTEIIQGYAYKPEIVNVTLTTYNMLGKLWLQRDSKKAQSLLETAVKCYTLFQQSGETALNSDQLFLSNPRDNPATIWNNFDNEYTITLCHFRELYDGLGYTLSVLIYGHEVLQRRLNVLELEPTPLNWTIHSARLSQKFLEVKGYTQARHHLAASTYVLNKYEKELNETTERNHSYNIKYENFKHCSADISAHWARYGMHLFKEASTNEVLTHPVNPEDLSSLYFSSLNLQLYEQKVTDQLPLTPEDAKKVLFFIQASLDKALIYYTTETLSSGISGIATQTLDLKHMQSFVYSTLVSYKSNPFSKVHLCKSSIDILEELSSVICPTGSNDQCRKVWYRLGQDYYMMVQINSELLEHGATEFEVMKLNTLVKKSIDNFSRYIKSYPNGDNTLWPIVDETFDQQRFLLAHLSIGMLYGKYVTSDIRKQLQYCEAATNVYNKINEYYQQNLHAAELFARELDLVREQLIIIRNKQHQLRLESLWV